MRIIGVIVLLISLGARGQRLSELTVPESLGVNIHFTDPKPGEVKMIAKAGFRWVRMDFTWGGTERAKEEYNFGSYDRLLAALQPHGIRAHFILDYANKLYDDGLPPHTDEGRQAMAKWAVAAVTHFKGKGVVWEMWNEPNIAQFWKPRPNVEEYAKLAVTVAKAIRAAAPEEIHVGPATSTIDFAFLETCFKAGLLEYWDAVSVHPYRQSDPETVNDEYRKLRLMIARYAPPGKKVPIISGEWGYSAGWTSFDEDRQGKYLPRQLLTNLYNEVPVSIWYDWHDDGQDPKEAEHHFGTVHNPYRKGEEPAYEPKPAYVAMKTLTDQLGGFSYNKRLAMKSDEDWVLVFAKGEQVRLAAWTTAKDAHEVVIPASPGTFAVKTHLGEKGAKLKANEGGLRITLTDGLQYLVPTAPNDFLKVIAAWERMPLDIVAKPPKQPTISWRLRNPLDHDLRSDEMTIPPDASQPLQGADGGAGSLAPHVTLLVRPPLLRSSPPRRTMVGMSIAGMGEATQSTVLVVVNPLSVRVYPPVGKSITVGVSNPSGDAFDGEVELRDTAGLPLIAAPDVEGGRKLKFDAGATDEVMIRFPMWENVYPNFRARVRIMDGRQTVAQTPPRFYRLFPDNLALEDHRRLEDVFRVTSDGDRKVASTHELKVAKPPMATPSGDEVDVVKLAYGFDAGWKYLQIKPATEALKKLGDKSTELGIWVYGDGSRTALRLRFIDSEGQTFQPNGPIIDFKGWRYVTIPLNGPNVSHWGKGDGKIHYPIKWDTLLLIDNVSREKVSGELFFAGITLIE